MKTSQSTLIKLTGVVLAIAWLTSASAQLSIGLGYVPVHQSGQVDFTADQSPVDVFALYERGSLGLRVDYNRTSSYAKDRFSFTQSALEVSLQYSLQRVLGLTKLDPYLRAGVSNWSSDFTTEGYPGIQDYELKIESDKGLGAIAALGIQYSAIPNLSFGLEAQYAMNGNAQFIAGGFDPQPLAIDQIRLMLVGKYTLFAPGAKSAGSTKSEGCYKF